MMSSLPPHYKRLAHGAASYVPPLYAALLRSAAFVRRVRGKTAAQEPDAAPRRHGDSAAYCYNVWLRHLIYACEDGLNVRPQTIVEIGHGGSLGVGIAALISGADRYYAIDPYGQTGVAANLAIFDEMVEMFRRRAPAPAYNAAGRNLSPLAFPHHILDGAGLEESLAAGRLDAIRDSIEQCSHTHTHTHTHTTHGAHKKISQWHSASATDLGLLPQGAADIVFSQHTLEHIANIHRAFRAMAHWLKPGGLASHVVSFGSHRAAETWDGHWAWGEFHWKLLRGRPLDARTEARSWETLNRKPLSAYIDALTRQGFEVLRVEREWAEPTLPRRKLAPKFRGMTETDRTTRYALIQARRIPD